MYTYIHTCTHTHIHDTHTHINVYINAYIRYKRSVYIYGLAFAVARVRYGFVAAGRAG